MKLKMLCASALLALSSVAHGSSVVQACGSAQQVLASIIEARLAGVSEDRVLAVAYDQGPRFGARWHDTITIVYDMDRQRLAGDSGRELLRVYFNHCLSENAS